MRYASIENLIKIILYVKWWGVAFTDGVCSRNNIHVKMNAYNFEFEKNSAEGCKIFVHVIFIMVWNTQNNDENPIG